MHVESRKWGSGCVLACVDRLKSASLERIVPFSH